MFYIGLIGIMLNETLAEKNILICIFPKSSQRKMYKILKRPYLLTKSWNVFLWIKTPHMLMHPISRQDSIGF